MKKFQRTIEDFVCENCGEVVKGDGYTNHCPACLWSLHVDVNPGDRQNPCGGAMRPVDAFLEREGQWRIIHKCERCGEEKKVDFRQEDNLEVLEELLKRKTSP